MLLRAAESPRRGRELSVTRDVGDVPTGKADRSIEEGREGADETRVEGRRGKTDLPCEGSKAVE